MASSDPSGADTVALRTWMTGRAWLALGVVLCLSTLLWRRWSPVPTGIPPSLDLRAEPGSLVVMPLQVQDAGGSQSDWLRQGLAEMIRSQLGQVPGVQLVARHRLIAALREAGWGEDMPLPAPTAVQIARTVRAAHLVTGSFERSGADFVLSAVLVDVASGSTAPLVVRRSADTPLFDAVEDLCQQLQPQLRNGRGSVWRPVRLPTKSVEAYRDYLDALDSFARGGRQGAEAAELRLDAAVGQDPGFALAYLKKAEVQSWRRAWGYGDPDPAPAVRAAAGLAQQLPERERLLVESYQALFVKHQPRVALARWDALLQFHPMYAQEIGLPGVVADTLYAQGRWDDLILLGEAHVDAPSLAGGEQARLCSLLAQAYRRKGQFARGLGYAHRAVRQWPVQHGPRFLSQQVLAGRIGLEAGERAAALRSFDAVAHDPEADATSLTDAAWGAYMAGDRAAAVAIVASALAHDPGYGNAHHLMGWLELTRGDAASATRSLETAFLRTPHSFGSAHQGQVSGDLAALYYAGVAAQRAGQQPRARALLGRLIELCQRDQPADPDAARTVQHWQTASYRARAAARLGEAAPEPPALTGDDATFYVQSARLHAVSGRREQALRELAQGLGLGFGEYRHLQDDPDFESVREDAAFHRLVTDKLPRSRD